MDDFAVIKTGSKQYIVYPKMELVVDDVRGTEGKSIELDNVIAKFSKGKLTLGSPTIEKAVVKATVVEHGKNNKIRINKFKAKARYRKAIGHRSGNTKLLIESI